MQTRMWPPWSAAASSLTTSVSRCTRRRSRSQVGPTLSSAASRPSRAPSTTRSSPPVDVASRIRSACARADPSDAARVSAAPNASRSVSPRPCRPPPTRQIFSYIAADPIRTSLPGARRFWVYARAAVDWLCPVFEPYIRREHRHRDGPDGTLDQGALQQAFMTVLVESTATLFAMEPVGETIRFKGLGQWPLAEVPELLADPNGFIADRFGGGKFKVNFHH